MDGFFEVDAGFFSRDAEVNMATASAYGVSPTRCYGSLEEMLESERESLDALCILTPIPDHIHSVTKAMRAGFDVICEKALASSLQEAKIIQDTEEETQKRLLVTFNYIGYPMVREARAMIERGALGDIQQIFARCLKRVLLSLTLILKREAARLRASMCDPRSWCSCASHDAVLNKWRRLRSNGGHCGVFWQSSGRWTPSTQ